MPADATLRYAQEMIGIRPVSGVGRMAAGHPDSLQDTVESEYPEMQDRAVRGPDRRRVISKRLIIMFHVMKAWHFANSFPTMDGS